MPTVAVVFFSYVMGTGGAFNFFFLFPVSNFLCFYPTNFTYAKTLPFRVIQMFASEGHPQCSVPHLYWIVMAFFDTFI